MRGSTYVDRSRDGCVQEARRNATPADANGPTAVPAAVPDRDAAVSAATLPNGHAAVSTAVPDRRATHADGPTHGDAGASRVAVPK